MYDNSLVVVGEGVGEVGDDHLGAYHDLDDGGDDDEDSYGEDCDSDDNDDAGDDAH